MENSGNWEAREALEGEEEEVGCNLGKAEEILDRTTEVLFEDFTNRRIDPTMTVAGLQLVQDAKEACSRGDKDACRRLQLIQRFLERVRKQGPQ